MTPIQVIRELASLPADSVVYPERSDVRHARLMLLEFMTILLVLPIEQVNLLVGGPAGLLLIVHLYDALSGGPSQDKRNSRNLN